MAEHDGRAVAGETRKDNRIIAEERELFSSRGILASFPQIEGAAFGTDVIKALPIRFPQGPQTSGVFIQKPAKRLTVPVVHPDLTGLGTVIALAPPHRTFAREQQPF